MPRSRLSSAGARAAWIAAVTSAIACSDRSPTAPADTRDTGQFIVSAPTLPPFAVASVRSSRAGSAALADRVSAATPSVFVSMAPQTVPDGVIAAILNRMTGEFVTTWMTDGGFDPVAIAASVGDEVTVNIRGIGNTLVTPMTTVVPRRRPPVLVRAQPPNGKTDVPLNTRIAVVFSEPVDPKTIPTSVQLFRGTEPVAGSATLAASGLVATFVPDAPLTPSTQYTLVLTTDIRNAEGDALEALTRVSFTTREEISLSSARIAFISDRDGAAQLYVIHADGSGLVRLTNDSLTYGQPAWSPDGKHIAVVQADHGIIVMEADGSNARLVAPIVSTPFWSPDGAWLRFGTANVQEVKADGSESRTVCTQSVSTKDVPSLPGYGAPMGVEIGALSWSPDGHRSAFTVFADYESGDAFTQVYQSDDHCREPRRVTALQGGQSAESAPAWSPDGTRLALWSAGDGIDVVDPDSPSNVVTAVPQDWSVIDFGTFLSWSPDGRYVAFVKDSPPREIRLVLSSGGEVLPIGAAGLLGWDPAWAPR